MKNRNLNFFQLVNLSFGFFGVQIAYALQSANISRIFATLGADPKKLNFFWILPPLMGMIVQPLIGKWSDRTWCRMGRRKPYLLVGALIAVLVMAFLPNAGSLHFSPKIFLGLNMAMWFGLFALMFLDTSINMAMQPFKMMVGDMVNERQKTTAYSIQSFLCNLGSLVGFLLPIFFTWIGIANEAPKGEVPPSVITSFYVGAAILILCVLYTFITVREMPPKEYAEFHGIKIAGQAGNDGSDVSDKTVMPGHDRTDKTVMPGHDGTDKTVMPGHDRTDKTVMPGHDRASKGSSNLFVLLFKAPSVFWTVGLVQFFCWAAFLYMWTYTNGTLAYNCWNGAVDAASADYQAAGNWVGVVFAVQAVGSIVWAIFIPLFKNIKTAYIVSLLVGAIGFVGTAFIHDKLLVCIPFFLIGFAWAAMLALPFTILTNSLEGNPFIGSYLGLFNGTICLPQIFAAATGGLVLGGVQLVQKLIMGPAADVHISQGRAQSVMLVIAGAFLVIGAACVLFIKLKPNTNK